MDSLQTFNQLSTVFFGSTLQCDDFRDLFCSKHVSSRHLSVNVDTTKFPSKKTPGMFSSTVMTADFIPVFTVVPDDVFPMGRCCFQVSVRMDGNSQLDLLTECLQSAQSHDPSADTLIGYLWRDCLCESRQEKNYTFFPVICVKTNGNK